MLDKSGRDDGTFSHDDFAYDPQADIYLCPAGVLTSTGTPTNDGATLLYRASKREAHRLGPAGHGVNWQTISIISAY